MIITYFKDLFKSTDVPYHVSIDKSIERIKNGKSKDIIEHIRSAKTKTERDEFKKKLPAILFSGKFSQRNKDSCEVTSGLMIVDFDKLTNYDESWNNIINNSHCYFAFRSPSGDGIKAVIRIAESNKTTYTQIFKAFQDKFKFDNWDKSNSDISRVCFESYDPNCYVNKNAKVFDPILIDEGYKITECVSYTPLTDEGKIIERIMAWDWKGSFSNGQRNEFIFSVAGMFCEFGIQESTALNYIKSNVAVGDFKDFSESEINASVKNAYRRRSFNSRFFEDYDKKKKLETEIIVAPKDEILKKYDLKKEDYDKIKKDAEHDIFWYFDGDKVKIETLKYKLFLERNGFKKYFHTDSQKPTWLKIESNKVSETSPEKIKDFVLNYLMINSEFKVWTHCANFQNLFADNFLLMLETIELLMLKDTKDSSFIAYQNGILEVTKDKIELIDYIDVDGYIWDSQIIKRNWLKSKSFKNDYQKFIHNISGGSPEPIECTIGFLLSTYKNKMNNKAIMLNDEVISDNPEGGTGKGLFVQGLRQIRRVSILDGKTFDDKKSFPYQTVSAETQILVFDDVKKNWDFETKFSLVTEGITLERKNKDAIKLTVEESPKMVVSTNYAIRGEGNSHDRRRHEIEIAQFYGKNLTPYDEFGKQLFDDWTESEFLNFDNYMVNCIQLYLTKGLINQDAKNIKLRKLIAETSMDFYEWISDEDNFPRNTRNDKNVYFDKFIHDYQDYNKYLRQKSFTIWLKKYANFMGYEFMDANTHGVRWFELITDKNINTDEIPF